jgi:hypothetical protein
VEPCRCPAIRSPAELDDRIAVLRANIRKLIEQAAGASGGQNEDGLPMGLPRHTEELDGLVLQREAPDRKQVRAVVKRAWWRSEEQIRSWLVFEPSILRLAAAGITVQIAEGAAGRHRTIFLSVEIYRSGIRGTQHASVYGWFGRFRRDVVRDWSSVSAKF